MGEFIGDDAEDHGDPRERLARPWPGPAMPATPPPLPPDGDRSVAGDSEAREKAREKIATPNGTISFYNKNRRFQCVCNRHPACVLTRKGERNEFRPGQGMPFGLMAAWMERGSAFDTKAEHTHPIIVAGISRRDRLAARRRLRARGGAAVEHCEDKIEYLSNSEPELVP